MVTFYYYFFRKQVNLNKISELRGNLNFFRFRGIDMLYTRGVQQDLLYNFSCQRVVSGIIVADSTLTTYVFLVRIVLVLKHMSRSSKYTLTQYWQCSHWSRFSIVITFRHVALATKNWKLFLRIAGSSASLWCHAEQK